MARLSHLTERGRETRRLLRDTLMELILEKGLEAVTVKDITERAGVDRTTFYLHFKDIRALLEWGQRQVIDDLAALAKGPAAPGEAWLAVFEHIGAHAVMYRALLRSVDTELNHRLNDYTAQRIAPILRARMAHMDDADDTSNSLLSQYVTSALRGTARWWLEQDMPYTAREMASMFHRLITQGLAGFVAAPGPARDDRDHAR
ncbi:MAG: TetR/AcrR family transcriptional regulator [Ktedonobacterales bacterium]